MGTRLKAATPHVEPRPAVLRPRVAIAVVLLMTLMTVTLFVASALHFGVTIVGIHDSFRDAAIPEAVIAGVLASGLGVYAARLRKARQVAIGATLFALAGFLVGVRFTIFGDEPIRGGDVAYHVGGLVVLSALSSLLLSPIGGRTTGARPQRR